MRQLAGAYLLILGFVTATLSACGGGGDSADAGQPATALSSQKTQAEQTAIFRQPTKAERKQAVEDTIKSHAYCNTATVGDFYWEIGDANGRIESGQRGSTWSATSQMNIASASKWVAGAFVVEKTTNPDATQTRALNMHSGYVSQNDQVNACTGSATPLVGSTIHACGTAASNSTLTTAQIGKFNYASGHAQQLLISMGYGSQTASLSTTLSTFGTETRSTLGMDSPADLNDFSYVTPIVAGGMRATPTEYAKFLTKMMVTRNPLKMKSKLGTSAVCTTANDCGSGANQATLSPVPENGWKYSLHHWVEPDGTFSSPGRNGFYPWIDKDKALYGILARKADDPSPAPSKAEDYVYWKSVQCGRKIRAAWLTATKQN
jgi:hypothetical protein